MTSYWDRLTGNVEETRKQSDQDLNSEREIKLNTDRGIAVEERPKGRVLIWNLKKSINIFFRNLWKIFGTGNQSNNKETLWWWEEYYRKG